MLRIKHKTAILQISLIENIKYTGDSRQMTSTFYTNQDKSLSEIINGILPKSSSVDILVGYFYFSGYKAVSDKLVDKKVRILVGLDVDTTISKNVNEIENFKQTLQSRSQIKENYFNKLVDLFNNTDILDSKLKLDQFKAFLNKIYNGTLEIRKTLDPCHAKMYIFSYNDKSNEAGEEPGSVITGSSNLSYQGLEGRIEINARFTDKKVYADAMHIFEQLWQSSVNIVDSSNISEWNEKVIEHIWYEKIYSPYLLFIRVLHEFFNIPAKDNLLMPYDITEGRYHNLRYQTDAVQMALNALDNHNGAIIADVVGLGKSIIASTIARNLKRRTIVICPPHLKTQWEMYRDEFGFTASIFSSGTIETALNHYLEIAKPGEQFLIIIDEAHRFRNEYTQDYANLHHLCSGNKVLLLTATPFNNEPADIYSLIKLFQIPSRSTLKTVENLGTTFKELIAKYQDLRQAQPEGKLSADELKKEVADISKQIRSIINPLIIRRSRIDLQQIEEYKKDLHEQGIQLVIPDDPEELTYDLGKLKPLYLTTLDRINADDGQEKYGTVRFQAARYYPAKFINPDLKDQFAKELEREFGIQFNMLIGRQANVSKFMRHMLVARFESSIAAFQSSLDYMIQSSEHMLRWIDKRHKIPVYKKGNLPEVDVFYESTDDGFEEIENAFDKYTERGLFEIDMKYITGDFLQAVQSDLELLKNLREEWFGKHNKIEVDPKLESFITIIRHQMATKSKRKLIVFSGYADTVNYLGAKLKEAGLPAMKYTSADASVGNKETIRANFDANVPGNIQCDDYQILVATDAISEGYNLHRAGAIFNYDIPYNPTRVIQRIGRINRVNKKVFDKLYIYNYFPTSVGEKETHVKDISTLKMAMIHAIMGEDTKALTSDEQIQAFFKDRFRKELSQSEQESWDTFYRRILDQVKGTEAYQQALEIPHRARIARKTDKTPKGVLLFGKKGNDFVFKLGTSDDRIMMLSAEEALNLFAAEKNEAAIPLSSNFDITYQKVKAALFKDASKDHNEKDILLAVQKVKVFQQKKMLPKDYLDDLLRCLHEDSLSGYEIRYINKLTPKDIEKLPKEISNEYLSKQIEARNRVNDSEETLILSEELQ